MPKLSASSLKAMLAAEKADALAADNASKLSKERSDAMDYYRGDITTDIPDVAGKSKAVSTDVADTVDGLMPSLMEIFCGGDEVVKFSPVGPEDEQAAEQETDYVNHVFMQKNPGFLVIYSFIKDALLSKNGIVKVFTEKEERQDKQTLLDQPDDALALIVSNPDYEITEHSKNEQPDGSTLHDITYVCKKEYACHRVMPVPPEEFGVARRTRNDLQNTTYCFHECPDRTVGELIEQGYDERQVKALPSEAGDEGTETSARDSVDEGSSAGDEGLNDTTRPVKVTEHYVRMDYEGNGKPALYRVVTGGDQGEVLKRDGKPDVEEIDAIPFASMTPIPITHRFFGRSIADIVMDIQRIKTVLLRGALDNLYLHNNPRVEVSETFAGPNTLDDLLISRPGGIVRTKNPGGLNWQTVPDITTSIYPALEYFDATREWRTGVTRQGQGIDASALQNQSATAANQMFTMAMARVRLIARIFAETGIRDLFSLLHAEIRKHGDKAQTVRLRNQWVQVDPTEWKQRNDLTINVGLGTGGKQQQLSNLMALIGLQKEALAAGKTNLVDDAKLFNSAKEFTKLVEYKNPEAFFNDPQAKDEQGQLKHPPPPPQPDPKLIELQVKSQLDQQAMQSKAEIEKIQAQADIATQDRKTTAEMALAEKKFELERQLKMLEAQIKVSEHQADIQHQERTAEIDERVQTKKIKMEANAARAKPGEEVNDEGEVESKFQTALSEMSQRLDQLSQATAEAHKAAHAPRQSTIVRDPKTGKATHAVHTIMQ